MSEDIRTATLERAEQFDHQTPELPTAKALSAGDYEIARAARESLQPEEIEAFDAQFLMRSIATGAPVAVLPDGRPITPLDFWDQLIEKHKYEATDVVPARDLVNLLEITGVKANVLKPTSALQDMASGILETAHSK